MVGLQAILAVRNAMTLAFALTTAHFFLSNYCMLLRLSIGVSGGAAAPP